ncbi:hypothetical protein [Paenarthrobacter ilicis]|uniref:DUF3592 domain-containing protein n=1 Tax=Paenarthrobacter ilicis TaxID=43665 RepID=A0ABX0TIH7_9MICC|nr:hypothetical protein [Paenarthrobacter ilicis]MBM7792213.1 hypothetical protein [Paenarthrobacter ilicis]NIJ00557.1 hypothetical protein [Paenarthrobacter ilicis]
MTADNRSTPLHSGSRGRRRLKLLLWRTAALLFLIGAIAGSAALVTTQAQVALFSEIVPATVIAQDASRHRGEHCVVQLDYVVGGQGYRGSFDTNSTCRAVPGPGSDVMVSVYSHDPRQHLKLVGHDGSSWTPWPAFVAGALLIGVAWVIFVITSEAYKQQIDAGPLPTNPGARPW